MVVRSGYPGISAAGRGGYPGISPATNVGISYPGILATREFLALESYLFKNLHPGIAGYPGISERLPGNCCGDGF